MSVSGNVTGQVIVVQTFDELDALGTAAVSGKIVCFNQAWTNYDESVEYRSRGPSLASKYGAIGVLLRSVASFSIDSPHTVLIYKQIRVDSIMIKHINLFQQLLLVSKMLKCYSECRKEVKIYKFIWK